MFGEMVGELGGDGGIPGVGSAIRMDKLRGQSKMARSADYHSSRDLESALSVAPAPLTQRTTTPPTTLP